MYFDLLFLILGLTFGSFLSAVAFRYPRDIPFVKGRSFCPKCKHKIEWRDNIPLLSFVFLGGKCRNCKRPISWREPLIELAVGIGFLLVYSLTFKGGSLQGVYSVYSLVYYLIVFSILVLIFVVDLEHRIIPDAFVFFGIAISFSYFLLLPNAYSLLPNLFSGFLAATFLLSIFLITRGRGMGLGDVKFAVWGGMITGLKLMPVWLFSAFLTGAVVGIILILGKKAGLKSEIAFGPFLVVGLVLALLCGEQILGLLL